MKNIICIYHGVDYDGKCSAAIVNDIFYKEKVFNIPVDHDYDADTFFDNLNSISALVNYIIDDVFIVDFCFKIDVMKALITRYDNKLHWIDHHVSAIEMMKKANLVPTGKYSLQKIGDGACKLVWKQLFPNLVIPRAVNYIFMHDVWDKTEWEYTEYFHNGLDIRHWANNPGDNSNWHYLFNDYEDSCLTNSIIKDGVIITSYIKNNHKEYAKNAFEMELEGLKLICINKLNTNSSILDSIWDKTKYDAIMTFGFDGTNWRFSLYANNNDKVDVSKIAIKFGGGGHKGASGFYVKEIPEEIKRRFNV